METANIKSYWIFCPICGNKTREKIRVDNVFVIDIFGGAANLMDDTV